MDHQAIQGILRRFGVKAPVRQVTRHIFYNDLSRQPPEYKLVAGLVLAEHPPLILKCLKEARSSGAYLSEQYLLSELFLRHHIPTARRLLTSEGRDHLIIPYQQHSLLVALEEDLGSEIPLATLDLCRQSGALLGRMHSACAREGFHMREGRAIFDFARESDVDAGIRLVELLYRHGRAREGLAVKELYEARRNELLPHWHALPRFAVQGDLSINNLVRDASGELMVFDYNCAGEAALISDAVLEGLFFAREMPYDPMDASADPTARFTAFFGAYQAQRPLTGQEDALWRPLYQAADAFWFTRYFYGEDSLDKKLEKNPALPLDGVIGSISELLAKKPPI